MLNIGSALVIGREKSQRGRELLGAGSWYALAFGVVALIGVSAVGALAGLVVIVLRGETATFAGATAVGLTGLLAFAFWMTLRMALRSLQDRKLRRRGRAIRQLLRALLRWLLHGGRRAIPVGVASLAPSFLLLCGLALAATAVGFGPGMPSNGEWRRREVRSGDCERRRYCADADTDSNSVPG